MTQWTAATCRRCSGRAGQIAGPQLSPVKFLGAACCAGCCPFCWVKTALIPGLPPPRCPSAGFHKAGGSATASQQRVLECIEAAKLRGKEVRGLLQQALEAAGAADGSAAAGAS